VLISPRIDIVIQVRINQYVIHPGPGVWNGSLGPLVQSDAGKPKPDGSHPSPPVQHCDRLLLTACCLACSHCALSSDLGLNRGARIPPEVILVVCQLLLHERESACDSA
jgi:hypothetical protein